RRLGDEGDGGVMEMEVVVRWCGDDEGDDGVWRLRRGGEARRLLDRVGRPKIVTMAVSEYFLHTKPSIGNFPENNSQGQSDLRRSSRVLNMTAVKNPNWTQAINNEIEALNKNNTWTVCDLPVGRKLDISNAFLYGNLSEDVYMTLSPRFDTDRSKVCKLNKSLYGLKQSPRHGFVQYKFDYSLFTKNDDKVFIILLVYVDDIVVTRNNLNEIEKFKQFIKSKFQIKDLGKLKYFLGIEVLDNKDGICLSQRKYCLKLLHEFGLLAAKHVDTPLLKNATLNHTESDDDYLLVNVSNYQRLVVLRYLTGSPRSGIKIDKTGNLKLRAYADSDWARCPATRKSISGYFVFLGDSLITWKSKKQSTLSRSSAKAEYKIMASATCEVIWLSNLLGDMGVKNLLPVVMVSQLHYPFSLSERLKANNTVRVNQIVSIFLIESLIQMLDQNQYLVNTSLIHIESRKPSTAELFDVDSGRISIVTVNTKEYHSDVPEIITRIMRRTLDNNL
nr:ribonuclease H-like domain-containing protein [Tanacetum cinerariifolium]